MARIVPLEPEAPRQRRPREKAPNHLDFIRSLPCCLPYCNEQRSEAAHVRAASALCGKRQTGKAEKPDDKWTVPLCTAHHGMQHRSNELQFWSAYGIDVFKLCLALWAASGDEQTGRLIIAAHKERRRV